MYCFPEAIPGWSQSSFILGGVKPRGQIYTLAWVWIHFHPKCSDYQHYFSTAVFSKHSLEHIKWIFKAGKPRCRVELQRAQVHWYKHHPWEGWKKAVQEIHFNSHEVTSLLSFPFIIYEKRGKRILHALISALGLFFLKLWREVKKCK